MRQMSFDALLLSAGALVALVEAKLIPETAKVTFKDEYARFGTKTIGEILNMTDDAIGVEVSQDDPTEVRA